jgi:KDO2-lipid IV(A) lauroyltransferase
MIDFLVYIPVRILVFLVNLLPLDLVVRMGRALGMIAFYVDKRHRNVAIKNMTACFGDEKDEEEIRALAKENFKRIGENFSGAMKIMLMHEDEMPNILTMSGTDQFTAEAKNPVNRIFAVGHFGNFELYARSANLPVHAQFATTYRGLPLPSLERLLSDLRSRTGCLYFERRRDAGKLRKALQGTGLYLGLLSDQHAGDRGLRLPFFGRECSVSTAPAVYALRYNCPLHVTICYRTALARWHIDYGEEIPTHENGKPREVEDITRDINKKLEDAIRRDPANWFWVHNRWKPAKPTSKWPKNTDPG